MTSHSLFPVVFHLNGEKISIQIDPHETLYSTLRERLRLVGTKGACLEGECGSCTILLDGKPVTSCLVLTAQVAGRKVTTIEGFTNEESIQVLQKHFVTDGAVQCGYCTPGLILNAAAFLEKNQNPTENDIRKGMEGNLCRCTGYNKIVDAIKNAARTMDQK